MKNRKDPYMGQFPAECNNAGATGAPGASGKGQPFSDTPPAERVASGSPPKGGEKLGLMSLFANCADLFRVQAQLPLFMRILFQDVFAHDCLVQTEHGTKYPGLRLKTLSSVLGL